MNWIDPSGLEADAGGYASTCEGCTEVPSDSGSGVLGPTDAAGNPTMSSEVPGTSIDAPTFGAGTPIMPAGTGSWSPGSSQTGDVVPSAGSGQGGIPIPQLATVRGPNSRDLGAQALGVAAAPPLVVAGGVTLAEVIVAATAGASLAIVLSAAQPRSVNLDSSTLGALSSADPRSAQILSQITATGRNIFVTTIPALLEFARAAKYAGPVETAKAIALVKSVIVVAALPSVRAAGLRTTNGIGLADILIFGTGDLLGIPTATSDGRAVRSAAAQGVVFQVIQHQSVSFIGK